MATWTACSRLLPRASADFDPASSISRAWELFPRRGGRESFGPGCGHGHGASRGDPARRLRAAGRKQAIRADDRFHPHVTLGRFKPGRRGPCDVTAVVERYRSWSCGDFTAFEVVGFASRLDGEGPSYEPLSRARLAGEKSKPLP